VGSGRYPFKLASSWPRSPDRHRRTDQALLPLPYAKGLSPWPSLPLQSLRKLSPVSSAHSLYKVSTRSTSCVLEKRLTIADCFDGCSRVHEIALNRFNAAVPFCNERLCLFEGDLRILTLLFVGGVVELVLHALTVRYGARLLGLCLDAVSDGPRDVCRYQVLPLRGL